ncbi:HEAT repeat domain-containing protein [Streptomyces sp. bgisy153]|uniref:HEAT repeat domain-containing protein n=1 Tax=Streptomyces sp. bgisy153 TaxID=3413793 RepID=UPI003D73D274
MFTGIDEVDWASLRHAYGSAHDVPVLLRGLASADPAQRETALDEMYGTVHFQGAVYDSTLACVPFLLRLVRDPAVAERSGLVDLLVSIGDGAGAGAVRAGSGVFVELSDDPDACVRRAAAGALVRFLDEPARVLALLRERLAVEPAGRVLLALTEALGLFVRRHPGHAEPALALLAARSRPPYGPEERLAALGQLAGCAPDRVPTDLVRTAVGLLRERSAERARTRSAAGAYGGPVPPRAAGGSGDPGGSGGSGGSGACGGAPGVDTLVGRLRRLRPSDEEGARLLRTLHTALGDRSADRTALLAGQLTSPDAADRCNAVWMAAGLVREWRGDHRGTVGLVGRQLDPEEPRLCDAAVSVLDGFGPLAAPAADPLHALVVARPDLWVRPSRRGATRLGGPLQALVRSGDARAVPILAEVLAAPLPPYEAGSVLPCLGPAAAPLVPLLCRRLADLPADAPGTAERAAPLLRALAALGAAEAVPEILRLLHDGPAASRGRLREAAFAVLAALGPAGRSAVPMLRAALHSDQAGAAARALWAVEPDVSAVLPVLVRESVHDDRNHRTQAVGTLALLGGSASAALPVLRRRAADARDEYERAAAAAAVCAVRGCTEETGEVLRTLWTDHPPARRTIAAVLTRLGPAAAPLRDLADTEVAQPRRHTARRGGYGIQDVPEDEELLTLCREILTRT